MQARHALPGANVFHSKAISYAMKFRVELVCIILECGICEQKLGLTANTYIDVSHQYVLYGGDLLSRIHNHHTLINLTEQVKRDIPDLTGEY